MDLRAVSLTALVWLAFYAVLMVLTLVLDPRTPTTKQELGVVAFFMGFPMVSEILFTAVLLWLWEKSKASVCIMYIYIYVLLLKLSLFISWFTALRLCLDGF